VAKGVAMRIVILGAGGTGGYFGAKLAKAGEDVTFIARGEHLRAIRERGLVVRSAVEGEWSVKVRAVESPEGIGPVDLVLFCVKSFDTEQAAESLRSIAGLETGILSIQNGVDNEDKIGRILGAGHVLGGIAYVFSFIEQPGIIVHRQLGRIVFGEMSGGKSERAVAFLAACRHASIPAEISTNIRKTLWEKYVSLAPIAGATSLTRLPVKFIREVPETRRLWEMEVDELLLLAKASDAGLDENMKARCGEFLESLAPENTSSLYQDLLAGKRLELEALHGHAVRLGERYGIPTPALFAVYAALKPYAGGKVS
jgi:2-dehydropantoate 2-reductase